MNVKIEQMIGRNGPVKNQFILWTPEGKIFQSYATVIARISNTGEVTLDRNAWDYSVTTGRYRNIFLNENKQETERKIKSGEYKLADLN